MTDKGDGPYKKGLESVYNGEVTPEVIGRVDFVDVKDVGVCKG